MDKSSSQRVPLASGGRIDSAAAALTVRRLAPGVGLALAVAIAARLLSTTITFVPDVLLALVVGILLRNVLPVQWAQPGCRFVLRYVLRAAIILMGGTLTLSAMASRGASVVALVIALFAIALAIALAATRAAKLPGKLGLLIGAGTAICGASAIVVIAPLVRARDEETAYAIATIFTFNLLALLVYPVVGHEMELSQAALGTWAGTSVNDTSVVIATGLSYGHTAAAIATLTKLIRTMLLVPLALGVGIAASGPKARSSGIAGTIGRAVPWFILGFVALAALHTTGALPSSSWMVSSTSANFLIVIVLASVGLAVDIGALLRQGVLPLAVGLIIGSTMSLVSLGAIAVFHLG